MNLLLEYEPAGEREWAFTTKEYLLNDELYRREYADIAAGMDARVKRSLAFLLEEIKEDSPKLFERPANYILGKINGSGNRGSGSAKQ